MLSFKPLVVKTNLPSNHNGMLIDKYICLISNSWNNPWPWFSFPCHEGNCPSSVHYLINTIKIHSLHASYSQKCPNLNDKLYCDYKWKASIICLLVLLENSCLLFRITNANITCAVPAPLVMATTLIWSHTAAQKTLLEPSSYVYYPL